MKEKEWQEKPTHVSVSGAARFEYICGPSGTIRRREQVVRCEEPSCGSWRRQATRCPRRERAFFQANMGLDWPQVNYKIVPWAHDDDAIPPGGVTKTRLFGLLWQLQRQSLQVRLEASLLVLESSCDGRFESVSLGSLLPEAFPPSVGPGTRAFVSSLPSLAPKLRPASVWASSMK